MVLGYLVPEFPSQTHVFFWREIVALRSSGIDVRLISTRRPSKGLCRHDFADQAQRETHYLVPFPIIRVFFWMVRYPKKTNQAISYIVDLPESSRRSRVKLLGIMLVAVSLAVYANQNKLSHIHVHSCADSAHLAAMCNILSGVPYSLTLHGDLPVYGVDHAAKMQRASFVRCVTRALQNQVHEALGYAIDFLPVLCMGVDTKFFSPREGVILCVDGVKPLVILTVARLNVSKGIKYSLEAVRILKEEGVPIRFRIAGEGPERNSLENLIETMGLSQNVELLGTMSESEVVTLLNQSDVFLLSSIGKGEAAPVSVMEAMSCKKCVICTVIGGTPDMIKDGYDGFLVPQKDPEAIASRLRQVWKEGKLLCELGENARYRALKQYDSTMLAERFSTLINMFCKNEVEG